MPTPSNRYFTYCTDKLTSTLKRSIYRDALRKRKEVKPLVSDTKA